MKEFDKTKEPIPLIGLGIASIITSHTIQNFNFLGNAGDIPKMLMVTGLGAIGFDIADKILNMKSKKYEKLFRNCNLMNKDGQIPKFKKEIETDKGKQLVFSHVTGLSSKDWNDRIKVISEELDIPEDNITVLYEHHHIILDIRENELLHEYSFELIDTKCNYKIPIGYTYGNKLVIVSLKDAPHIGLYGETNSGKSTLLRGIITWLLLKTNSTLDLIDLKGGNEFQLYEKVDKKRIASISRDKEDAIKVIHQFQDEVTKRLQLLYSSKCVDSTEYNKKYPKKKLNKRFLIIDEFSELRDEKQGMKVLEQLGARARSVNCHLIICTQSPRKDIVTGLLKSNIGNCIALKTLNALNSRIILDEDGCEKLKGMGNGYHKFGSKITEFQAFNITPEQTRELMKELEVKDKKEYCIVARGENLKITKVNPNKAKNQSTPKRIEETVAKRTAPQSGEVQDLSFLNKLF